MATDLERLGTRCKSFSGKPEEWHAWMGKFEAVLMTCNLEEHLTKQKPDAANSDDLTVWSENSKKIYAKLMMWTGGTAQGLVQQYRGSYDGCAAWRALVQRYEPRGTVGKLALHAQLMSLTMGDNEDPENLFTKMNQISQRLNDLKDPVSESTLLGVVLRALPSTYEVVGKFMQHTKELTLEDCKEHVRAAYFTLEEKRRSRETVKALIASQFRGKCGGCGEQGHAKHECTNSKKRQFGDGGGCDSGGGGGRGRGRGRGGGGRGGRGSSKAPPHITCFTCGKNHWARDCPDRAQSESANPTITVPDFNFVAIGGDGVDLDGWIVDSGCTSHMVSSARGVTDVQEDHTIVIVGGNMRLEAEGRGQLKGRVITAAGEEAGVTLHDVLIVPDLGRNLLSTRRMAEHGAELHALPRGGIIEMGGHELPLRDSGGLYLLDLQVCDEQAHVSTESPVLDL